jgi:hypothetical protein
MSTDDPEIMDANEVTIDFTSTPDPIRESTRAIQSMSTTAPRGSLPSAMTLVLQDVTVYFGMDNVTPEHRGQVWHRQRLGQYYNFDVGLVLLHKQPTGWDYLRKTISSYVSRAMGAMLSREQLALFQEDQHLQIYIATSDSGFSDVLHEPSYDRTLYELSKYVQQESINLTNFSISIAFFSPAFLDPIMVPRIVHDGARSAIPKSTGTSSQMFSPIHQEETQDLARDEEHTAAQPQPKSVSWTSTESDSTVPRSSSPRPKHPMFQNVNPSAWVSPRTSQVPSSYQPRQNHDTHLDARFQESDSTRVRTPVEANRSSGVINDDRHDHSAHMGPALSDRSFSSRYSPVENQHDDDNIHNSTGGVYTPRSSSPTDAVSARVLSVPILLDIGPRNPRDSHEIYGSRFFINDHLPYALRRYWQPEKVTTHALPSFVASTTGFRWYEACCDHLLSHGIYLPPYHCLRLNDPLGTSWGPLVQSFAEARDRLRPWSRTLRIMLQKLVDDKGITHPIPGAAKFADIVALCDNDGYQAFYDIMEYHATQLNLPAVSNIKSHNIPRMKPTEHLKQFTHRFEEHFIQRYYRNGYNVQPPELHALYMESLPAEIVRHFRVRIWTFDMDNHLSVDAWRVGTMDFRLHFDHIVKAILNECKMNGMNHSPSSATVARKATPNVAKVFKVHALTDGLSQDSDEEVEELSVSALSALQPYLVSALHGGGANETAPCVFCRSPNHRLSQCLSLARLMNGFEILQANPDVVKALKAHQATFVENPTSTTARKPASPAKNTKGKSKFTASNSNTPKKGSSSVHKVSSLTMDNDLEEVLDNETDSDSIHEEVIDGYQGSLTVDLVHDLAPWSHDASYWLCSATVSPIRPTELHVPTSLVTLPSEYPCLASASALCHDSLSLDHKFFPDDVDDLNDRLLPSVTDVPSEQSPYTSNEHAHIDHGANISVSNQRWLLWGYQEIDRSQPIPCVRDLSANIHRAEGRGYYCLPLIPSLRCILIPALYCPTIHDNIVSPGALCRSLGDGESGTVLSHVKRTGFAFVRLKQPPLKLVIRGIVVHGQLWTESPFLPPSSAQRSHPVPVTAISDRFITLHSEDERDIAPALPKDVDTRVRDDPETALTLLCSVSTLCDASSHSVSALHQHAQQVLWHARTGHISLRRLQDAHKFVTGIPSQLPSRDEANACPVCLSCKMRRCAASKTTSRTAQQLFAGISIDFGFIAQRSGAPSSLPDSTVLDASDDSPITDWSAYTHLRGCNGETAYLLLRDHWSGALWGTCTTNKSPPIDWLSYWLLRHPCTSSDKYVRMDQGGDLGGSRKVIDLFTKNGYSIQLTGSDAPHQNGPVERVNQDVGNAIRSLLVGADLPPSLWPYAFHHALRLYNMLPHSRDDATDPIQSRSPMEIVTGQVPNFTSFRTFGCRVYVRPPGGRVRKSISNTLKGRFLGYTATLKNIIYMDESNGEIKEAFHAVFDEAFNDLEAPPPNAVMLRSAARESNSTLPAETVSISSTEILPCFDPCLSPVTFTLTIKCAHQHLGFVIHHDEVRDRGFIHAIVPKSTAASIPSYKRLYIGAYFLRINDVSVQHASAILESLHAAQSTKAVSPTVTIVLAPDAYQLAKDRTRVPFHLDQDQLSSIHCLRQCILPSCTTFQVASLGTRLLGSTDEQSLKRLTRSKLKRLATWELWHRGPKGELAQLDEMHRQGMYGEPVYAPSNAIILRQHWVYTLKADGTRKARNCCDGSYRAAPILHGTAKTYASCIEQPCMRLFFALASLYGLSIYGADATNAFANSPPPAVPTFVAIDDAYADWYLERFGITLDRTMVLPVQHALQGHPESGYLWELTINSILTSLGFSSTTHERNLYRATIQDSLVLVCRQVDDLAIACSTPNVADDLIASLQCHVTMKNLGLLTSFNGVDIDQTQHYIKISCSSYLRRFLLTHHWDVPSATDRSTPFEPLAPSVFTELQTTVGPAEHTSEHKALETSHGFRYRQVIGELIYAYVVARLDIGFAISCLSKYNSAPAAIHYRSLVRLAKYLRQNLEWGLIFWRVSPHPSLPLGSFTPISVPSQPPLPPFPPSPEPFHLVGFADAAHATDLTNRRSFSGFCFLLAGAAVVYKSKQQSVVATSATEAEFICAVQAAKTAKYLRTVLSELQVPQSMPTIIYEDNRAAIDMVNSNKPTPRSRHIDIQHFAIQEWKRRKIVLLEHIPGVISPPDALTKALGWVLHSRHVRRMMGHYGPPEYASYPSSPS